VITSYQKDEARIFRVAEVPPWVAGEARCLGLTSVSIALLIHALNTCNQLFDHVHRFTFVGTSNRLTESGNHECNASVILSGVPRGIFPLLRFPKVNLWNKSFFARRQSLSFLYVCRYLLPNEPLDRLSMGPWICASNPIPSRINVSLF